MKGAFELRIQQIKGILKPEVMAQKAYDVFRTNTPIRTGNARRNTHLFQNTIEADYPYAIRLDEGWSKQRPAGMTEPTLKYLQNYIKKNLGK